MSTLIPVRVKAVRHLTPVIREFTLVPCTGRLPGFSAGSHVQLHLPTQPRALRNAYSLLSDPACTDEYRIAVRRQESSRGGSHFLHDALAVGDRLNISPPANLFPIHPLARHHVLIAAGIGITPFMAYVEELLRKGASFELHYAQRTGLTDAYAGALEWRLGTRFHGYTRPAKPLDLKRILAQQPLGSHLYVCGPSALLSAVQAEARAQGWPAERVHFEAFAGAQPGTPFSVSLARSGQQLEVPGELSLLEALEAHGLEVPNLCRGGVCGQCVTGFLDGQVEHRDHYLSDAERKDQLMPCVSRGCGQTLVIDL